MHYHLLILEKDKRVLDYLQQMMRQNEWTSLFMNSKDEALEALDKNTFDLILMNKEISGMNGLQILEWTKNLPSSPAVILMSYKDNPEEELKALKLGAFDFVVNPGQSTERLYFSIRNAIEKSRLLRKLDFFQVQDKQPSEPSEVFIGKSAAMKSIFEIIRMVSSGDSNVLIQGESGTGKELIAKAIHQNGIRKKKPFVVINCAAMPETLLESELFGYTKGSFTGAQADKKGLFEVAHEGTVFLDEIGDISLATQVKLLRVLQEGEIRRVGDTHAKHVDVRILAATNKNLGDLIKQGTFREDLYYRLNVINIHVPALRERFEDIPLLAYHFLHQFSHRMEKKVDKISVDALQALQSYLWPGNVRELENVMERAVVLANDPQVTAKQLPSKVLSTSFYSVPKTEDDLSQLSYQEAKKRALNIFNRSYIINLLEKSQGNITAAAEKAGMDRSNFRKIIRKCRIPVKDE